MAWVDIPELGQGLNLDANPEELPLGVASGGSNVRFRDGRAERFNGIATVYTTPLVAPYHITHYTVGATKFVVYAGLQKTYVDDGSTQTDITNANNTGAIDNRYTGGILNGVYIQNNGVDVPQYWGGSTGANLANLTAWPAGYTVGFMRPFKNFLVCGDVTRGAVRERSTFLWSHTADPGTIPASWDIADPTKDAGDVSLAETNGTLIDAAPLGDTLVIYKDDAIHFAQFVGAPSIFRFGRMPGDTGLLCRGGVVVIPAGHVYISPGFDVLIHTGQGPQSILNQRMRRWLSSSMNADYATRSFLCKSPDTNEVLICFPSGASQVCDKALVWNYQDNTFAIRALSNVTYGSTGQVSITNSDPWSGDSGSWESDTTIWNSQDYAVNSDKLIFTRSTPALALYDASTQDYGSSFTATWERVGMHFDAPYQRKLCRGVRISADAGMGTVLFVQVGSAEVPDGTVTWSDPVTYTVGTDEKADLMVSGKYLGLRIYTTGDNGWKSGKAQMDIVGRGGF